VKSRIGDTPVIHKWVVKYGCPGSASRLPPITSSPAGEFTASEACAVAWRAREAWTKSPRNPALSLKATLRISHIAIEYLPVLIKWPGSSRFEKAQAFNVAFEKTPTESTILVGIDRNTGNATVALGHPPSMRLRKKPHD
jgi:hypothetical protein